MAARVIKSGSVDDDQFPMPADPSAAQAQAARQGAAPGQPMAQAFDGVEPAELQHALGELQQMVGMITGMRPAVQELSEHLRSLGAQQGYDEGTARAQREVEVQLMEVMTALTAAQQERHRLAQQHESALADLALGIARKVIGAHLEADPTLVQRIVSETVRELEPSTALEVRVSPDDLTVVEQGRAELERLIQGSGAVTITPDPSVDRGGVILISPVGEVDARIATKLSVLETAFAAQRRALVDG
jgi:flagellar biosynthesis/type III secretory pathway protein FliH